MEQKDSRFGTMCHKEINLRLQEIDRGQDSPSRSNKLKRTRSSFNLNDKMLKQTDQSENKDMDVSTPPIKPIKRINHSTDHLVGIEPRLIIKEAFKNVDAFGS